VKVALTRNWVAQACLIASLLFTSVSCQKKSPLPANPRASQPLDHFVGTWKLNKEKTPVFSRYAYNPIPVYEWVVISGSADHFTLMFSHLSDKPWEMDRVLLTDMKKPGISIDAVNGKLMMYDAYGGRIDADHFSQGNTIFKNDYTVLPDQKTMTVIQFPMIDNGRERQLVYDKATASGYYAPPHF
jgi:hypothetical protein